MKNNAEKFGELLGYVICLYIAFQICTYPLANVHYIPFLTEWSVTLRGLDPKIHTWFVPDILRDNMFMSSFFLLMDAVIYWVPYFWLFFMICAFCLAN